MSDFEVANTGAHKKYTETELALAHANELLRVAKCPNAHCVDGVIQEGFPDDYDVFQCQWCADRKLLLAERE